MARGCHSPGRCGHMSSTPQAVLTRLGSAPKLLRTGLVSKGSWHSGCGWSVTLAVYLWAVQWPFSCSKSVLTLPVSPVGGV